MACARARQSETTPTIKLKNGGKHRRVLAPAQVQKIPDAREHLGDRPLFALLLDTGAVCRDAAGLFGHLDSSVFAGTV
ncbi:hypothetical protein [Streptomyces sp. NPDC056660]|uniref:hypothetical protein n=1 Tax=Streptomyces sp. NPDC056660 TaxID=3345897 RepID=UPI0036B3A801